MRKRVIKVGTSAAVTISPAELRALGVAPGDEVEVTARGGTVEIRAVDRFQNLSVEERFALIDRKRTRR